MNNFLEKIIKKKLIKKGISYVEILSKEEKVFFKSKKNLIEKEFFFDRKDPEIIEKIKDNEEILNFLNSNKKFYFLFDQEKDLLIIKTL